MDYFCYKKQAGKTTCVPPLWLGEKRMGKTKKVKQPEFMKCGASDYKFCAADDGVAEITTPQTPPSPPGMPEPASPTWPPLPPLEPGAHKPAMPPMPPGTTIVPCVDKIKTEKCTRKAKKGKCFSKKVYTQCPLTCKKTCIQ